LARRFSDVDRGVAVRFGSNYTLGTGVCSLVIVTHRIFSVASRTYISELVVERRWIDPRGPVTVTDNDRLGSGDHGAGVGRVSTADWLADCMRHAEALSTPAVTTPDSSRRCLRAAAWTT